MKKEKNIIFQILLLLGAIADLFIDICLHIAGLYLFFFEREYVMGSLVLGMATIYQAGCLYMRKLREDME